MLQIIGWLLCAMMIGKAIEMVGNTSYRVDHEDGKPKMTDAAHLAVLFYLLAALSFGILLHLQGSAINNNF